MVSALLGDGLVLAVCFRPLYWYTRLEFLAGPAHQVHSD